MTPAKAALAAIFIGLIASGQAMAAERTPEARIQTGWTIAATLCAGCHMATPHQLVQPLDPNLPSFQQLANSPGTTADSLMSLIHEKHPQNTSPTSAQVNISDADAADAVAYILSLRQN